MATNTIPQFTENATPKLCKCGCGETITPKRHHRWLGIPDYVLGHNARTEHPMKGKKHSPETLQKLSDSHMGLPSGAKGHIHDPGTRNKMSVSHTGIPLSKKHCRSLSIARIGKPHPGAKGRISPMKGKHHTEESKKKNSETKKMLWRDHPEIAKKCLIFNSPNKMEIRLMEILDSMYPSEWKFVGDGQVIIDGKCPDFINVNGQKKIVELYGERWHQDDDPQDRINIFKPFGYDTLIIWSKELWDMDNLTAKLQSFCGDA